MSKEVYEKIVVFRQSVEERAPLFASVDKGGGQIVPPLVLNFEVPGGEQKLISWSTEGLFRLIQSIPDEKTEPFKYWLACTQLDQEMRSRVVTCENYLQLHDGTVMLPIGGDHE